MDYDILILGGGIFGCAIAYELSKYSLNIAVIEKEYDVATDIELINNSIVYDGLECEDDLMSILEMEGNKLIGDIANKFNVSFQKINTLFLAHNEEVEAKIQKMYERAIDRGLTGVELLSTKQIKEIEPNLKGEPLKAIYSKNTAVIAPYDFAIALSEVAFDNGVNFRFSEKVSEITKISKGFQITTNKNRFKCKIVINTILEKNYNIDEMLEKKKGDVRRRKLNYFTVERDIKNSQSNIIINYENLDEKTMVIPTGQNIIGAVVSPKDKDLMETKDQAKRIIRGIQNKFISSFYSTKFFNDNVFIDDSLIHEGYIRISGKNYGDVTLTPAISRIVCETVVSNLNCTPKKNFIDKRREHYRFRELSNEERQEVIKVDNRYGKIVCVCSQVSEGEIIDAIRRPLGARTVEGVKRRTGAILGSCKGSTCYNKVVTILAREMNRKMTEIVKDSKDSNIVVGRIKEFDEV
ncbi:MAG: NAD(P)/FAD-dependent oxidoreductase [Clostridiaceae bacterium]